jgi:SAM-dependent methyltransferase
MSLLRPAATLYPRGRAWCNASMAGPADTYDDYLVPAIFARWAPSLIDHARPRASERALDIACGTGIVSRTLAPLLGREGSIVALDVNPAMLEVARSKPAPAGAPVDWREGSAQVLPDGPFDVIVCQQGLQFFPDPEGAVREMHRVLAPGGRAVVSVWQDIDVQPVFGALMKAEARFLDVPLADIGVPFMLERRHALEPLFRNAGFSAVAVTKGALESSFPDPDRFLELTLMAGAAVIPELAEMDDASRSDLLAGVKDEVKPLLDHHTRGDQLVFEMHNNTVVGRR